MRKTIIGTIIFVFVVSIGMLFAQDTVDGFRVQVFATAEKEKADNLKSELDDSFPGEVYVFFEEPNYKVRIGNCTDRDAAENLLLKIQELGFPTAWIVSTSIKIAIEQDTAPVEAVIETSVEEVIEDVIETANPLDGFAVGFNVGIPVKTGLYLEGHSGINYGLLIGTPYGLPLGPLNIGVGFEVLTYDFPDAAGGDGFTGMAYLGTLNIGLNDLPFLPENLPVQFSAQIGTGLFGGGFGTTIGGAIDIPLEKFNVNLPLAIKLYARGNAMNDAGADSNIEGKPTGWINAGMMVTYDVSTLF